MRPVGVGGRGEGLEQDNVEELSKEKVVQGRQNAVKGEILYFKLTGIF